MYFSRAVAVRRFFVWLVSSFAAHVFLVCVSKSRFRDAWAAPEHRLGLLAPEIAVRSPVSRPSSWAGA